MSGSVAPSGQAHRDRPPACVTYVRLRECSLMMRFHVLAASVLLLFYLNALLTRRSG
jgi:hypothetical protein